jgi:hypothetical protein
MQEISCPRCGALFAPQDGSQLCPHCGKEVSLHVAQVRSFFLRHFWRIFHVALVIGIVAATYGVPDWKILAIASLILAGGLLWASFLRYGHGSQGSIAKLNLDDQAQILVKGREFQVRPPVTPKQWEKLVCLSAPREVHLDRTYKIDLFVTWLLVLVNGAIVWRKLTINHVRHETAMELVFFSLLYVLLPLWITVASIRRELAAKELLRDGEVTIGCWGDGAYQFWTRSGERFERPGPLVSGDQDVLTDPGLVPVFYSRHDPSKSAALCCVRSRVQVPSEVGTAGPAMSLRNPSGERAV